jgi:hypothetical protein
MLTMDRRVLPQIDFISLSPGSKEWESGKVNEISIFRPGYVWVEREAFSHISHTYYESLGSKYRKFLSLPAGVNNE